MKRMPSLTAVLVVSCSQLDGSPPCYRPEILHYCEGLCTARSCETFEFEERTVDLFICARPGDQLALQHRFTLQAMKRGYGVNDCSDPICRPSIDDGSLMQPPPYHEQGESEAAGAYSGGTGLPPQGDCVP